MMPLLDDGRVLTLGAFALVAAATALDRRPKSGSLNHGPRARRMLRDPERARRITYLLQNSDLGNKSFCEAEDWLWSISYNEFLDAEGVILRQLRDLKRARTRS